MHCIGTYLACFTGSSRVSGTLLNTVLVRISGSPLGSVASGSLACIVAKSRATKLVQEKKWYQIGKLNSEHERLGRPSENMFGDFTKSPDLIAIESRLPISF